MVNAAMAILGWMAVYKHGFGLGQLQENSRRCGGKDGRMQTTYFVPRKAVDLDWDTRKRIAGLCGNKDGRM